jgi:hypothetical protein
LGLFGHTFCLSDNQVADRPLHVNRVPVHDGRYRQVEIRSAIALVLERAIDDPTLTQLPALSAVAKSP